MGSEDIRKQLPLETKMFEGVNDMFIASTLEMHVSSILPRLSVQNLFGFSLVGSRF